MRPIVATFTFIALMANCALLTNCGGAPDPAPSPTAAPTRPPTAEPSPTPDPDAGPRQPRIVTFEVTPDDRADPGMTVALRWAVEDADDIAVCYAYRTDDSYEDDQRGGECLIGIEAAGTRTVTLGNVPETRIYYVIFRIDVTSGDRQPDGSLTNPVSAEQFVYVPVTCSEAWNIPDPPRWCPFDAGYSAAGYAQPFERGLMVWSPQRGPMPHTVYVFRPEAQFGIYVNAPEQTPLSAAAPPDLLAPNARFFAVWAGYERREPQREALGWATAPEQPYTLSFQCEERPEALGEDRCFITVPDGTYVIATFTGWWEWDGEES